MASGGGGGGGDGGCAAANIGARLAFLIVAAATLALLVLDPGTAALGSASIPTPLPATTAPVDSLGSSSSPAPLHVAVFHNTRWHVETTLALLGYLLPPPPRGLGAHVTLWGPTLTRRRGGALAYLRAHPHPRLTALSAGAVARAPPNVSAWDAVVVITHYSVRTPERLDAGADPTFRAFLALAPHRRVVYVAHRAELWAHRIEAARGRTGRVVAVAPQGAARANLSVWLPARLLQPPRQDAEVECAPRVLVVQGSMRPGSRDMAGLQAALLQPRLAATGVAVEVRITGFNATWLGGAPGGGGVAVRSYASIGEADFHALVRSSHVLLPLISPTIGSHEGYFRNKLTSSVALALAYHLPMVLHAALADVYGLPRDASITYEHSGGGGGGAGRSLADALLAAAEMSCEEYRAMRRALRAFVAGVEARGVAALQEAIEGG